MRTAAYASTLIFDLVSVCFFLPLHLIYNVREHKATHYCNSVVILVADTILEDLVHLP